MLHGVTDVALTAEIVKIIHILHFNTNEEGRSNKKFDSCVNMQTACN
jgi:hypothetical protein